MSALAENPVRVRAERTARVRAVASALVTDRAALAGLLLISVALTIVTWNRWGDFWLDSGYDLVAAAKVSHANAPYIDFDYWYGPIGPLVLGVLYEIFGIGIGPAVGLGLVTAFAVVGLAYAVARLLVGVVPAFCVGLLAAVPAFSNSNVSFVQPHTYGATIGILLMLGGVLVVARHAATGERRWLVALGVLTGLVALTRHECFGAMAMGVGIWLLVRVARSGDRRGALRELGLVVGLAAAIGAGGYVAFLVAGLVHGGLSLNQLIHDDLFPRGLMRESVAVVFKTLAPGTPASIVKLGGMVVLYAGGVAALIAGARALDAGGRTRRIALAVAVAGVAVFLIVLLARPDSVRFYLKYAFMWLPAGAVLGAALLTWRATRRRAAAYGAPEQVALVVAVMLVGLSYSVYARYWPYPNPDFPQETAYGMAIVAAFLAWFHLRELPAAAARLAGTSAQSVRALGVGWLALLAVSCAVLLVHDSRAEPFAVHGIKGTMNASAVDGPTLQRAVDLIERSTNRSEPILLAPQMTSLYVLTGRTDPLRQLSLLPGALDGPKDEAEAITAMDDLNVRFAITDRTPLTRYEVGPFGIGYDQRVGAWLRKNFTHTATLRGSSAGGATPRTLDVWIRRAS